MNSPRAIERLNDARMAFEGPPPERAQLLPTQERWFEGVKAKRSEVDGEDLEKAIFEASEAWFLHQERERVRLERQFAARERQWRSGRDPAQELLALRRWERRYQSMDPAELDAEVDRYSGDPAGWDPDRVEILVDVVRQNRSPEAVRSLRRVADRADYSRPWLHDDEGQKLKALHALHAAPFGQVRVLGAMGVEDVNIADLFDNSPTDGEGRLL